MAPAVVLPVDSSSGREFDTPAVDLCGLSWNTVLRTHSGYAEAINALHEVVVVGVADAPIPGATLRARGAQRTGSTCTGG